MKTAKAITASRTAKPDLFKSIVLGKSIIGSEAVNFIRAGVPASVLKEASTFLGVSEAYIFRAVHVPPTTANRLLKNAAVMDSAITERVVRMGNTVKMALDVFESHDRATEWMRQPNRMLGGVVPLDLIDTEPGAQAVRQVLNAIATGGVA